MAKVLIIGGGGREHALGWKLSQSPQVERVFYAPGNGGTEAGKGVNLPYNGALEENFPRIAETIESEFIDLTVVGPEAPLTDGLVDFLEGRGIGGVFGPHQAPAQLEADKFLSYRVMEEMGVPQAQGVCCTSLKQAQDAIDGLFNDRGIVLKARGLAGGKGVVVCSDLKHARDALVELSQRFGPELLVSERLSGPEFSVFAICDGAQFRCFEVAIQDHKRLLDGDKGPNTGGMGAYGPVPIADARQIQWVGEQVIAPTLQYFQQRGTPYRGFLYAGMMLTDAGPKTLEFNVRFGDPECQPAMALLESDLYEALRQATCGGLQEVELSFRDGAACCVVLASQGYPGSIQTGFEIEGLEQAAALDGVEVFHAGTQRTRYGYMTSGGRVVGVTAVGDTLAQAQQLAYQGVQVIAVEGGLYFRTDIAHRSLP